MPVIHLFHVYYLSRQVIIYVAGWFAATKVKIKQLKVGRDHPQCSPMKTVNIWTQKLRINHPKSAFQNPLSPCLLATPKKRKVIMKRNAYMVHQPIKKKRLGHICPSPHSTILNRNFWLRFYWNASLYFVYALGSNVSRRRSTPSLMSMMNNLRFWRSSQCLSWRFLTT